MTLADMTYQFTSTGVVLNTDATLPFVDIIDVSGLDSAPFRETFHDHEGVDGGFMDAEFEKGRELSLTGSVYADVNTMESYLDSLKANYAPRTTVDAFYFKYPGVNERLLFCKPRGIRYNHDSLRRIGSSSIQFRLYAEDSRIYDSSLSTAILPFNAISVIGLEFPLEFPLDFGTTSIGASTPITNSGNRDTPLIFSIPGPVQDPVIVNDTLGISLPFNITLGSSDTLVVNTQQRTVMLNSNINRRSALTVPNWFLLPPGITELRYNAATTAPNPITITYRSAWR